VIGKAPSSNLASASKDETKMLIQLITHRLKKFCVYWFSSLGPCKMNFFRVLFLTYIPPPTLLENLFDKQIIVSFRNETFVLHSSWEICCHLLAISWRKKIRIVDDAIEESQ
jgi:hypothetical protein